MNKYIIFTGIGFELLGLVGVALWISDKLESKFHTEGLITVAAIMLSMVLWFIHLLVLIKKINKSE